MPDPTLLPSLRERDACMPSTSLALTPSHTAHTSHTTRIMSTGGVGWGWKAQGKGEMWRDRGVVEGGGERDGATEQLVPRQVGRGGMRLNLQREEREEASDESDGSAGARLGYPRCPKKVGRPAKPSSIVS